MDSTAIGVARIAIVGVSGYSGMELARITARHPGLRLVLAISDRWAGSTVGEHLPVGGASAAVKVVSQEEGARALGTAGTIDLAFLCTPAEVSLELAPRALDGGARVVDLSGAFRLAAADYPRWYGFAHPRPDLLAEAVYSMPEAAAPGSVGASGALRSARLCANPGCYPTASTLAVLPLLRAGIIERAGIVIDAKSGTTGAGRKASEEMSFSEVDGDFRAYRVLRHQHTPEIDLALARGGAGTGPVTFTAHLIPTRRGILATAYGRLRPGKTGADATAAVKAFVEGRPFLRAVKPDAVRIGAVAGTNRVLLGADADPERAVAIGFGAIDNLVKGAAGQAVQNANLMLGLDEATALDDLGGELALTMSPPDTLAAAKSFIPPTGFRYGAVKAGIKPDKLDLALIVSDTPCAAAGAFTVNKMCAAPVKRGAALLPAMGVRAVVANSGNANAMTGPIGARDDEAMAAAVAAAVGASPAEVLTASTGSIGVRLPVEKVVAAMPALMASLGDELAPAAEAIRTTDLRTKLGFREIQVGGRAVRLAAICKGSGMIHPQMATMLCFVTTDAALAPLTLQAALSQAVEESFHTITVDGDMSTNDCVLALANGRSGAPPIEQGSAGYDAFRAALTDLCKDLARAIAADGEGATKLLVVDVVGAPDRDTARELARAVAGGSLVKSGIFGGDPSWGRILAALGARIGARGLALDPEPVTLDIQGTRVYDGGAPVTFDKAALSARMRTAEILVRLDLHAGKGEGRALGCDLTFDYVKINAEYYSGPSTATAGAGATAGAAGAGAGADNGKRGGVNRQLIVESLSYIRKFAGKRCVIKYGGAAMIDPALKRSFAEEVVLLQSAGLRPVIVHGGGPEITKTLERLGRKSEFADGQRITGAEDVRVVEMVLTGRVNTEIVGLLNTLGGNAIGLSGKDGRLLMAHKLQPEPGKPDLGFVGEIESVNADMLAMFMERDYIPVISPVGFGADGASYNINADVAAAEIAAACGAERLIFLTDVAGILDEDKNLISQIRAAELQAGLGKSIKGGMHVKAQAILNALAGGVKAVHIVDGRVPHSVVAELFTDRGVGTLVT